MAKTPKLDKWEEEFDEFMLEEYGKWKIGRVEAKNFFAQKITEAQKQERARIREWAEKIKHIEIEKHDRKSKLMSVGYNQALSDLQDFINKGLANQ